MFPDRRGAARATAGSRTHTRHGPISMSRPIRNRNTDFTELSFRACFYTYSKLRLRCECEGKGAGLRSLVCRLRDDPAETANGGQFGKT